MERIYTRGSDDRINTDNQLLDLRQQAPTALHYQDVMSGSKKRKGLEQMIEDTQPGDVVWIWSLDRLTREGVSATLNYLARITAKKARVRSFKESWLDSENPCYELLVSCMAFAAKLERDRLIQRTTTGIRRARKEKGIPLLDKKAIAEAKGTAREVAERFGCSHVYVLQCRKELGTAPARGTNEERGDSKA